MGQLAIVTGDEPERVTSVFDECIALFKSIHLLAPTAVTTSPCARAAKFPKLKGTGTSLTRDTDSSRWACGAGAWTTPDHTPDGFLRNFLECPLSEWQAIDRHIRALDGAYVLAFGDHMTGKVFVATDRIGTLHVYKRHFESCTVICTSSLILAALSRPDWDIRSCREFLATGTVFENRTLFEGIEKLPPGICLQLDHGSITATHHYWTLSDFFSGPELTGRSSVSKLAEALQQGMQDIYRSYEKPVIDLTGGYDSRIIFGAALRSIPERRINTVVSGSDDSADVKVARQITARFAASLSQDRRPADWQQRWWEAAKVSLALCDGEYDILEYASIYDTHQRLAETHDISINGSAGEVCRGYWWELLFPFIGSRGHFNTDRLAASRFATDPWGDQIFRAAPPDSLTKHFSEVIERTTRPLSDMRNTAKMDSVYLLMRMQRWQGRIASATNRIWSCLSPFLFASPLHIMLVTRPHLRIYNQMACRLIEHMDPALAAMALTGGYPSLPIRLDTLHRFHPMLGELTTRARRHFHRRLPGLGTTRRQSLHEATNPPLPEECLEILAPDQMLSGDLYDTPALARFIAEGRRSDPLYTRHLGRLVTLELLARTAQSRQAP